MKNLRQIPIGTVGSGETLLIDCHSSMEWVLWNQPHPNLVYGKNVNRRKQKYGSTWVTSRVSSIFVFSETIVTRVNVDMVEFIHGPQGSGKTRMLNATLKDNKR